MSDAADQVIDMTDPKGPVRCIEIRTPAGIVRVSVGLENFRTGQQELGIEVEPKTLYEWKTEPGGDWEARSHNHQGSRVDVTLTRTGDGA